MPISNLYVICTYVCKLFDGILEASILFRTLQVWDTGGQERYRPVLATCYKNAFGVILVYDVTNKKTFANLQQWLSEVNEFGGSELPKVLIGKKL